MDREHAHDRTEGSAAHTPLWLYRVAARSGATVRGAGSRSCVERGRVTVSPKFPSDQPRWVVNASITFAAWVIVEADNADEALTEAQHYSASDFDYDTGTGEVEFDVTPAVDNA